MTKNFSDYIRRAHPYTLSGKESKAEIILKIICFGLDISSNYFERKKKYRNYNFPIKGIYDTIPEVQFVRLDKTELERNNLETEKLQTYDVSNLEEEPKEKPTQPINDTTSQSVSQEVENKAIMETASDTTIELNHSSLSKPTPLQYPPLFIREFGIISEQKNAIKSLYDLLDANGYIRCSSLEYFRYVFGRRGLEKTYKPDSVDYIEWTSNKASLQWLILRLYKQEGDRQLQRGTWPKVEAFFLLNGVQANEMNKATNHISDSDKQKIDEIIAQVISPKQTQ